MRRQKYLGVLVWTPTVALLWFFSSPALSSEKLTISGFSLSAVATGATLVYNDHDLPVPASPTAEIEVAFSTTTLNFGPVSHGLASAAWPGSTIAEVGPALGLLLPIDPGVPAYPVRAESRFPTTKGRPDSQTMSYPSSQMSARATPREARAGVSLATLDGPALIRGVFSSSAVNALTLNAGTSDGLATATDLDIMGGVVRIGSVTSSAKATSNGKNAVLTGNTVVANASVGGIPVVIDNEGVHAAGHDAAVAPATSQVQAVLQRAGIQLLLAKPVDVRSGSSAERSVGGLMIAFNGKDLAMLPGGDTLSHYVNLNRSLSITLGSVLVRAAASPADAFGVVLSPPSVAANPRSRESVAEARVLPPAAVLPPSNMWSQPSRQLASRQAPSILSEPVLNSASYLGSFQGIGGWVTILALGAWIAGFLALRRLDGAMAPASGAAVACSADADRASGPVGERSSRWAR